jgi:hypothetical protein
MPEDSKPTGGGVGYCNANDLWEGYRMGYLRVEMRRLCCPSKGTEWVRRMQRMAELFHPWAQSGSGGGGTGYDKRFQTRRWSYWMAIARSLGNRGERQQGLIARNSVTKEKPYL